MRSKNHQAGEVIEKHWLAPHGAPKKIATGHATRGSSPEFTPLRVSAAAAGQGAETDHGDLDQPEAGELGSRGGHLVECNWQIVAALEAIGVVRVSHGHGGIKSVINQPARSNS